MCGIFCFCSFQHLSQHELQAKYKDFEEMIKARGPNHHDTETYSSSSSNCLLAASVLWLQGQKPALQPLKNDRFILVYNGDIFRRKSREKSDTEEFFEQLTSCEGNLQVLKDTLGQIQGPHAFILLDGQLNKVFFARDKFGRRSLLIGFTEEEMIVTSVAKRYCGVNFMELPTLGCFSYDLTTKRLELSAWNWNIQGFEEKLACLSKHREMKVFPYNNLMEKPLLEQQLLKVHEIPNNFEDIVKENHKVLSKLEELLVESLKERLLNLPGFCSNCLTTQATSCDHAKLGVLFSGGVDCAILALLTGCLLQETNCKIDLINVAFGEQIFNTPDRKSGLQTLEELKRLCPGIVWNFVPVNVMKSELNEERKLRISNLIYPLESILDDSLGCALWFAARGLTPDYSSSVRVLIVGMGADELFGGYSRHKAAFQQNSWKGLQEVLEFDWQNLPYRNLGRDDRVVACHGKQLRTPYLDEEFVKFVRSLNHWEKTWPGRPYEQGFGDKYLLRALAFKLGLKQAASLRKKALQFGSKIASSKEKGHESSPRL